jgi:lipoprotein-releasing system permease protein
MFWYLQLALRQLFPSGKKHPSFFFIVSVLGVTLGVMILVIVQSVMGGFDHQHRSKMVMTTGHVDVRAGGEIMYDGDKLMEKIRSFPEVDAAVPYAQGLVMLSCNDHPAFPVITGMDFSQKKQVVPIERLLIDGSFSDIDDDSVFLSARLAENIGASVGAYVDVYTPLMIEKLKANEVMLPRRLRVCGIYETGWTPFDTNTMVSTLPLMQDLYDMQGGIHGVAIRLKTDSDAGAFDLADKLNKKLAPPERAETWMELNRDFLWVLAMEKNMMLFLLLFIILVAAFAISVAQLLTVLRKTREIGLLEAMGARPRHLATLYCFQGFFIGLCGTALGCLAAVTALHYRDGIVNFLSSITNSRAALVQFYQFSQLPVYYDPNDFYVISIATLVISTAAGLIPALRAAFMKPADALRSE